ncbi:hypothetical protein BN11_2770003 [Nostocoides australiense Ben110]|uniref:Uncharacterized protein n=1 Tax=Nostocoides australiense Ben110 TaxID=1193182 RepID=W6JXT8_9MICO|nr:hypothetical protein BN11_2770003 [Tetrasphaera australiensis Ben110]
MPTSWPPPSSVAGPRWSEPLGAGRRHAKGPERQLRTSSRIASASSELAAFIHLRSTLRGYFYVFNTSRVLFWN